MSEIDLESQVASVIVTRTSMWEKVMRTTNKRRFACIAVVIVIAVFVLTTRLSQGQNDAANNLRAPIDRAVLAAPPAKHSKWWPANECQDLDCWKKQTKGCVAFYSKYRNQYDECYGESFSDKKNALKNRLAVCERGRLFSATAYSKDIRHNDYGELQYFPYFPVRKLETNVCEKVPSSQKKEECWSNEAEKCDDAMDKFVDFYWECNEQKVKLARYEESVSLNCDQKS